MTDLKDYCLTCGNGPLHPDGIHSCYENPVIAHLKARIAELEGEKAERDKPCVWTRDFNERNECVGFTAECNRWSYEDRSRFCPDCGHPVEVKEEK